MQTVNKKMDPKKTLQTMQDFQKENLKMGMTEDMSENSLFNSFMNLMSWNYGFCGINVSSTSSTHESF